MTESGLTTEEENEFVDQWNLELSDNSNDLSEDEENEFELRWRSKPIYEQLGLAEAMIAGFKKVLCNKGIPDAQKPKRLKAKIRWWQKKKEEKEAAQKRFEDVLERKNKYDCESAKIRKKHQKIGQGKRTHKNPLNGLIDRYDLKLEKQLGRKQTLNRVKIYLISDWKKEEPRKLIDPDGIIVEMEDENACIRWRHPDGKLGEPADWNGFRQRLARIRKARSKDQS